MFIDSLLRVSSAQALAGAATTQSTNSIDQSNPSVKRQVGTGEPMGFAFTVTVAADAGDGDETYEFHVIQSANADLSAPDVLASRAIARATLAAGYRFFMELPNGTPTKRYIGVEYKLGGTTPAITCYADFMPRKEFSIEPVVYPKNYAV